MDTKHKVQLLLNNQGAAQVTLDDYITNTIAPMLYCKFDEASGVLVNYGSETGANGTVTGATQNQTGQMGAGEAYDFDGVDDIIVVANVNIPNVKALTSQRWAFLVNADNTGENAAGTFFCYGNQNGASHLFRFTTAEVTAQISCLTTNASATSTPGDMANTIDNWAWAFMDYDHASSRVIRFWKGIGGTLTALTKSSNTASVGAITSQSTALNFGNRTNADRTFDGLYDVVIADSGLWTTDEMQQLIDLSGV